MLKLLDKIVGWIVNIFTKITDYIKSKGAYGVIAVVLLSILSNYSLTVIGSKWFDTLGSGLMAGAIVSEYKRDIEHGESVEWLAVELENDMYTEDARSIVKETVKGDKESLANLCNQLLWKTKVYQILMAVLVTTSSISIFASIVVLLGYLIERYCKPTRRNEVYSEGAGI